MKVTEEEVVEISFKFTPEEYKGIEIATDLLDRITDLPEYQIEEFADQLHENKTIEWIDAIDRDSIYQAYAILSTFLNMMNDGSFKMC